MNSLSKFAVLAVLLAGAVYAAESVICTQPVTGSSRLSGDVMSDGGLNPDGGQSPDGGPCNWQKGSTLMLQCADHVVPLAVYLDSTSSNNGQTRPTASSADQLIEWVPGLRDPYIVTLGPSDQQVALISTDGGSFNCKWMVPFKR